MERRERREGERRDLSFVGYGVPDPMTSVLLVTPRPVIVLHSSLVSEVIEGQCNLTAMFLDGSIIHQMAQSTRCR